MRVNRSSTTPASNTYAMTQGRERPELVVLKHLWLALAFAAVWGLFPHSRSHFTVGAGWVYALFGVFALVTAYRTRVVLTRPNARILRYMPIFDSIVLAVGVRLTGGIESDLWLLYYFQLIVGVMDPRQRTMEFMAPLVIASYITGTMPEFARWDAPVWQVIGTRLFLLFLTAMLTRHIVQVRNKLSEELSLLSEQLSLSQERNRISREIHDGIGHSLVNCILTLELCEKLICKEPNEACKVIQQEKSDLRAALDDMRDFVHHLRPAEIENEQLETLIQRYLARFGERTGLTVRTEMKTKHADLPPSSRLVLLRIIQEALTNAAKHSDATEVDVVLSGTRGKGVDCTITDNGCGFDVDEILGDSSSRQGFGLRTMIDRASSAGGDLQVESTPGKGTTVKVTIPGI